MEGLTQLMDSIRRIRQALNSSLTMEGILLTMVDSRNRLSSQVEEDVRSYFGSQVYTNTIPRNVRLSEAPSFGLPAIVYDMKCSGAQAYIRLAKEMIKREETINQARIAA